jgi:plastocyanin
MFRRRLSLVGSLAVPLMFAVGLVVAPRVSAGDPCYHGFQMPALTVSTDTQIKVAPCAFAPTVAHVPVGSTVTFYNGPDFVHLITGANQAWGSRDTELQPGATVSYRFDKAGVFPYACALHRGMSGTIIVGDVATALAANTTAGDSATTVTPQADTTAKASLPTLATRASADTGILALVSAGAAAGTLLGASVAVLLSRRRRMLAASADQ